MRYLLPIILALCSCGERHLVSEGPRGDQLWEDPDLQLRGLYGWCTNSVPHRVSYDPAAHVPMALAHEVLGHLADHMGGDWRKAVESLGDAPEYRKRKAELIRIGTKYIDPLHGQHLANWKGIYHAYGVDALKAHWDIIAEVTRERP